MGRRYLLLHNYRDGSGKVCQRRLGHFEQGSELRRSLICRDWRADFARKHPELTVDWQRLRERAEELADDREYASRAQRIQLLTRNLVTLLREEGAEQRAALLGQLQEALGEKDAPEGEDESSLRQLVRARRARLPVRRQRFETQEPEVAPYLQSLEKLGENLRRQGRLEDYAEVLGVRAQSVPNEEARLAYGVALQVAGRGRQARAQYSTLGPRDARRHYNLASLAFGEGDLSEALSHILRGLLANRRVADALHCLDRNQPPGEGGDYWREHGHLWGVPARRFLLLVYDEMLVRFRLRRVAEQGVRVRELIPQWSQAILLEQVTRTTRRYRGTFGCAP